MFHQISIELIKHTTVSFVYNCKCVKKAQYNDVNHSVGIGRRVVD